MALTPTKDGARRRLRPALLAGGIALGAALVVWMATLALQEIDELGTANSDNVQWSLAQMDVEYLRFRLALSEAQADPDALDTLRRRFDIFYSRVATLSGGEVFEPLRAAPGFEADRRRLAAFLDETVPLIDGPDAALRAALPELVRAAEARGDEVRELSLAGLAAFARISDQRREEVMGTLGRMAALLIALFAGLALLAVWLLRLNRLSESRAEEIARTGARMRTIVDTSLDGIVVSDAEGRILEINHAAEAIFGYSAAEARGELALGLYFPDEDMDAARDGALRFLELRRRPDPLERQFELTGRSKTGRSFPVEISMDRAQGDDAPIYVSFLRDISRRKAAEEGLTDARDRALAGEKAKADFLAVMSHEMRTPLNGLLGSLQLLRDTGLDARQDALADTMQSSGGLLLGLVNDVLDLSKFEAGKMRAERRVFDLPTLLDGVVETAASLAHANGTTLGWSWVGAPLRDVRGDPRRLRQILLNLVGNAVKFTHDGSVEIEAERLGADRLEIRVIDTGIGIPEADLDRIFNDFETLDRSYARQAGGTGLGLGIARRLVTILDGEIGAESEAGEGSIFWVRLPVTEARTRPAVPFGDAPSGAGEARALSVLLVEDNEINRFVAREMLQAEGHSVIEAVNGRAGVEWAERRRFDAILMDISMPVMDGTEAARRIRTGDGPSARTPIVAVTAHALPEELERFRDAGMERCVSKPIDRAALSAVLFDVAGAAETGATDPGAPEDDLLIDTSRLSDLREMIGSDRLDALVEAFIAETEVMVGEAVASTDLAVIARQAHTCAGTSAALGLVRLFALLGRIEGAAKQGKHPAEALRDLPTVWAETRLALQDALAAA